MQLRRACRFPCVMAFLSDAIVTRSRCRQIETGRICVLIYIERNTYIYIRTQFSLFHSLTMVRLRDPKDNREAGLNPVKPELNAIIADHYCGPLSVAHEGK